MSHDRGLTKGFGLSDRILNFGRISSLIMCPWKVFPRLFSAGFAQDAWID